MKSEIAEIEKKLKKYLDKDRFVHTQGVMYTAAALAMAHGAIWRRHGLPDFFMIVQMYFQQEEMEDLRQIRIVLSECEKQNPYLIHAKLGVLLPGKNMIFMTWKFSLLSAGILPERTI